MELLFILSCAILAIAIYVGFVPSNDEISLIYLLTVLNTLILVFIMGVLVYG